MSLDVVITWSSNSHQTPAVILLFIHIYYNRGRFLGWFSTFLHQFPLKSIYITSCLFSGYITRVTHVDVTQLDFRRLSLWIIIWMPDFTNHPSTAAYIIKIPPTYILVYTFKCFRFQVFVRPNYKLFFQIMIFVPLKSSAWRSSMLFWFMFGPLHVWYPPKYFNGYPSFPSECWCSDPVHRKSVSVFWLSADAEEREGKRVKMKSFQTTIYSFDATNY